MNKKGLKKFEELLFKKRQEILDQQQGVKETFSSTATEASGDLSAYSYHMADQGTDNMEREKAFMFTSQSSRLIYRIDEALKRIKGGTYGDCHTCGKPISKARLTAVPHARYCIECKSKEEESKPGRR